MVAFPSFALYKVYYFFDNKREIKIDYHDSFLTNFNTKEKYVYIILFPDQFDEKFKKADPNGKLIRGVTTVYTIFAN